MLPIEMLPPPELDVFLLCCKDPDKNEAVYKFLLLLCMPCGPWKNYYYDWFIICWGMPFC